MTSPAVTPAAPPVTADPPICPLSRAVFDTTVCPHCDHIHRHLVADRTGGRRFVATCPDTGRAIVFESMNPFAFRIERG